MARTGLVTKEQLLQRIEAAPHRRGKTELLRFIRGERLTPTESIRAHCYDCMCFFEGCAGDELDCGHPSCTLYPLMPYHGQGEGGAGEAP